MALSLRLAGGGGAAGGARRKASRRWRHQLGTMASTPSAQPALASKLLRVHEALAQKAGRFASSDAGLMLPDRVNGVDTELKAIKTELEKALG